ncbi:MAG: tetratricopeptide repeat protein, partial [Myxococcota bacterium]
MGFFQKLFGRDWSAFKQRGDTYFTNHEWGRARGEYQEALRRLEDEAGSDAVDARNIIRDKLEQVHLKLYQTHLEKARTFEDNGAHQRAIEFYRLALDFAQGSESRQGLLDRIVAIEHTMKENSNAAASRKRAHAPQAVDIETTEEEQEHEAFYVLLSDLEPAQADVYEALGDDFRRGYMALMRGDLEDAEALLSPFLERDPDNTFLQYEVGRLRLAQDRYEEAEALLREACASSPDMLLLRHARIEALWGLNDLETAERVVEESFEIDDELLANFRYAGETCLRSGEYENGVEILEMGVEIHPNSTELYRLLGLLHQARDNPQSAIEAFETSLRILWQYNYETETLTFDHPSAFAAANLYLSTGTNLDRAEELFRALLSNSRSAEADRWAFLMGIGQVAERQGRTHEARSFYVDAVTSLPEDSPHHERLST